MFRRLEKFRRQRERDEARGIDVSQDAPPEALLNEDEGDSSDSGSSEDDSDGEGIADEDMSEGSDDEEESDAQDGSDGDSSEQESISESDASIDESVPPLSIAQSLQSPFFIASSAPSKAGLPWTTCLVCPLAQLKSDTQVGLHEVSKAHKRRFQRYKDFVSQKLTRTERENDFERGGADPRAIAREVESSVKRDDAKAGPSASSTSAARQHGKGPPGLNGAGGVGGGAPAAAAAAAAGPAPNASSEKAKARRERKLANRKAWKAEKDARRKAKKEQAASADQDSQPETDEVGTVGAPASEHSEKIAGVGAKADKKRKREQGVVEAQTEGTVDEATAKPGRAPSSEDKKQPPQLESKSTSKVPVNERTDSKGGDDVGRKEHSDKRKMKSKGGNGSEGETKTTSPSMRRGKGEGDGAKPKRKKVVG
ncbi:unnamed protein product [Jaminaea pallidilutea]